MIKDKIIVMVLVLITFLMINPGGLHALEGEIEPVDSALSISDPSQWEIDMISYANAKEIVADKTVKDSGATRTPYGNWTWRDGVICITDSYASSPHFNNGHAALMGSSKVYVTVEANPADGVQFKDGHWFSRFSGQVYQVGVIETTIAQDQQVARWAETQINKPYNMNFLNRWTRDSYYCSQLVWAAYKDVTGVDLDTAAYLSAIHPFEILNHSRVSLLYRKN